MRIAIFGVGALGCLYGARLAPWADVTLIGRWPAQLAALRAGPLRIVHPDGREERVALRATDEVESLDPVDVALILTKTPGTVRAAEGAARILVADGLAITLQNGLGNDAILAAAVGVERAALGITTVGAATRGQPGVLYLGGTGETLLAAHPPRAAQAAALVERLTQAGLPARIVDDAAALVWSKLAVNAAINPLTALLGVYNGVLLASDHARGIIHAAAAEVQAVAAAQGIQLPFDDAGQYAEKIAQQTASNRSSMLEDVTRGVATEIDAICGAVVRVGASHGVPTPINQMLNDLIRALETLKG